VFEVFAADEELLGVRLYLAVRDPVVVTDTGVGGAEPDLPALLPRSSWVARPAEYVPPFREVMVSVRAIRRA
jgi:hypothetical protein